MDRSQSTKLYLLIAVVLLAAFFRLYRIDRLPPAPGFDQAAYALEAFEILDGARPVFFETRHGREVMFSYLVALVYPMIGDPALAVYLTAAVAGILTVLAVYLAAREMLADEGGPLAEYGALIATLFMALSYWHLNWSRLGMRVILVPLFCALTTWLLWRGLRTGRRWAFAGAGVFLGLGMYTYPAFRAFPLVVVLAFGAFTWSRRSVRKQDLLHLALVVVVALAVFAPLGIHFVRHPASLTRVVKAVIVTDEARGWQDNARALLEHAIKVPRSLLIGASDDPRATLQGRPAMSPFVALVFVAGALVSLLRFRRPLYPVLLGWLAVMSVPAAMATDGATTKRALGAAPAAAILVAVGCLAVWEAARKWSARHRPKWTKGLSAALALLGAAGFVYTGARTYRDYFNLWGGDPYLFTHFEVGTAAIGEYVGGLPLGEYVYLSPTPADHAAIELYAGQHRNVKTYHGKHCLVVPEQAEEGVTYVVVPGEDPNSLQLLPEYLPQGEVAAAGPLHLGEPYYYAYRAPPGAEAQIAPLYRAEADWDGKIQFLGYDVQDRAYAPGESIPLTLYFQTTGEMDTRYSVFVHLLGGYNPATGGPLWAQDDSEPCRSIYPTWNWGVGEVVIDRYTLLIPPEAPAGEYQIEIGFYDWRTMARLPVVDAGGQVVGDHVVFGALQIRPGP